MRKGFPHSPPRAVRAREERDRRNLTPDQLALVMGRHYNRAKKKGGKAWRAGHPGQHHQNDAGDDGIAKARLAEDYGVATATVERAGKFAAAVETLKAVDPEIAYRAGPDGWRPRLRDLAESCGIRASRLRRTPGAIRRTRPPWRPVRPRVRP